MPRKRRNAVAETTDDATVANLGLICCRCRKPIGLNEPYVVVQFQAEEAEWSDENQRIEFDVLSALPVIAVCSQCQPGFLSFPKLKKVLTSAFKNEGENRVAEKRVK